MVNMVRHDTLGMVGKIIIKENYFYNLKQIFFLAVLYVTEHTNSDVIKLTAILTLAQPGY